MKIIRIKTCNDCPYEDWYRCQKVHWDYNECPKDGVRDDCPLDDMPESLFELWLLKKCIREE